MSLETEIYDRLSAYAGLTALVETRIYPVILPQNVTLPAIAYQRISSTRESAFGADTGDISARVQVDVYGESWDDDVLAVKEQVRAALQRWSNSTVQDVFLENEVHGYDEETEVYRATLDFRMWYKE